MTARWSRVSGRTRLALAVALVTLLDWPVMGITPPYGGVDPSWQMVLHLWGHQLPGLGPRIDFTYGPLGFLAIPTLWWSATGVVAWLAVLATTVACAYVAVTRLRHWLPLPAAVVVAFVVVRGLLFVDGTVAAWPLFAWWWVVDTEPARPRDRLIATVVLAALADVLLMCKFGDGIILAGVALAAPLVWTRRPWREIGAAAATVVLGSFALWSVLTLAPGQFGHYVKTSLALAGGYWEMTDTKSTGIGYLVAALLLAAALIGLALITTPRRRAVSLAAVTAWLLWLELKHGFVRADSAHVPAFFVTVAVLASAAALGSRRNTQVVRVAVGVVAVALTVAATGWQRDNYTRVWLGPHLFASQALRIVDPSEHRRAQDSARTAMRDVYALPPAFVDAIGRGTVQVDPFDAQVAWAYGLHLRPVPVFQLYGALTTALDRENVRAIEGERAPQFVLRHLTAGAIDKRIVDWESPAYQVALICHYRQVVTDGQWQLLARTPSSLCGSPQRIRTLSLRKRVQVPPGGPGQLVVATFDVSPSLRERLQRALFREALPSIEIDRHRYPFLTAAAAAMHLVNAPPQAPIGPGGAATVQMHSLRVFGSARAGSVTFWSIPYIGQPTGAGAGGARQPAL